MITDFSFCQILFSQIKRFDLKFSSFIFNDFENSDFEGYKAFLEEKYLDFENSLDKLLLGSNIDKERFLLIINIQFSEAKDLFSNSYLGFVEKHKYIDVWGDFGENEVPKKIDSRFTDFETIINIHKEFIIRTESCLKYRMVIYNVTIDEIFKTEKTVDNCDVLAINNRNKSIFNLGKSEIVLLFFLLQETKILKFENNVELYKFIEDNFKYTKTEKGKTEILDIKDVNVQGSRLSSYLERKSTDKSKSRVINKLSDSLNQLLSDLLNANIVKGRND